MGVKLKLKGFDDLLERIQKSEGNIDKVAEKCVKASAEIIEQEYKNQMRQSGTDQGLINRMDSIRYETTGNRYAAQVGYEIGQYNPKNLSDAFKALFINYGTPRIKPREYVAKMKKSAAPKVRKEQEKILKEILEELR